MSKTPHTIYIEEDEDALANEIAMQISNNSGSRKQRLFRDLIRIGFLAKANGMIEIDGKLFITDTSSSVAKLVSDRIEGAKPVRGGEASKVPEPSPVAREQGNSNVQKRSEDANSLISNLAGLSKQ